MNAITVHGLIFIEEVSFGYPWVSYLMRLALLLFVGLLIHPSVHGQAELYRVAKSEVHFHSDAPEELIKASSDKLTGIVDVVNRTFFLKIDITSFEGFNNALQKEHFNENYMESEKFSTATYSGKIIEDIDLSKDCETDIRTKGKLTIHGIGQQAIIKCHIICSRGVITIHSDFIVLLSDYRIEIPRILSNKLSQQIKVSVDATLSGRTKS